MLAAILNHTLRGWSRPSDVEIKGYLLDSGQVLLGNDVADSDGRHLDAFCYSVNYFSDPRKVIHFCLGCHLHNEDLGLGITHTIRTPVLSDATTDIQCNVSTFSLGDIVENDGTTTTTTSPTGWRTITSTS